MDIEPKKWVVIIIGPPGSGKDTQAELLARELKFVEIKSSKIIEDKLKSADINDAVMNHEKELHASGQLNTREVVDAWIIERIEEVGATGVGLVGNGWPREINEVETEMGAVEKFYDKDSIKIVTVTLSEAESVKRNSKRRVCEQNGHPIFDTKDNEGATVCPQDGSEIIFRVDDTPETISKRYQVYIIQTQPVIDFLSKKGYNVITINGEQPIEDVHRDILDKLWWFVNLKTPQEIELMREGGHILAEILDALVAAVHPNIQTKGLDAMARELIEARGAKPSFLNYNGFPAVLCVSINEEIVHGLPSERKLKDGDLVKLDLGVYYKGFHTDSARSVVVGSPELHPKSYRIVAITAEALAVGIQTAQVGKTLGDVGSAIHEYVKFQGYDVVRDLIGHGIGHEVHEEPEVPNYGKPGQGVILKAGMVIAIEPMVVAGGHKIANGPDGYSYITADKKLSAHIEHTVAITATGPEILTK